MSYFETIVKHFLPQIQWDKKLFPVPWGEARSIYDSIVEYRVAHPGLRNIAESMVLPDAESDEDGLRWVAGGLDGSMGHHGAYGEDVIMARRVARSLSRVMRNPGEVRVRELYELMESRKALSYVDPLLEYLIDDQQFYSERLHDIMRFFATGSPNREVVKTAIAVLGLFADDNDAELFSTIGMHEEFTLYAAIALGNVVVEPDAALWDLAKEVDGWGRIHAVERLTGTDNYRIRHWMLREGYRNSINDAYLAYTCATTADLHADLRRPEVDEELLIGAGDIIDALIRARESDFLDIFDYPDGAECVELYLGHVSPTQARLGEFLNVQTILGFLRKRHINWELRADQGWNSYRRFRMIKEADLFLADPIWPTLIRSAITSSNEMEFGCGILAAPYLGIDTWPEFFRRLKDGEAYWGQVMQTDDETRVAQVLEVAHQEFELERLGSGPALELGMGVQFVEHRYLDSIVYELRRFPGMGINLIKVGLCSPVVKNRVTALRSLATWGPEGLSKELVEFVRSVQTEEPDKELRAQFGRLLRGKAINRF